jgi:hypothetical protein
MGDRAENNSATLTRHPLAGAAGRVKQKTAPPFGGAAKTSGYGLR